MCCVWIAKRSHTELWYVLYYTENGSLVPIWVNLILALVTCVMCHVHDWRFWVCPWLYIFSILCQRCHSKAIKHWHMLYEAYLNVLLASVCHSGTTFFSISHYKVKCVYDRTFTCVERVVKLFTIRIINMPINIIVLSNYSFYVKTHHIPDILSVI